MIQTKFETDFKIQHFIQLFDQINEKLCLNDISYYQYFNQSNHQHFVRNDTEIHYFRDRIQD